MRRVPVDTSMFAFTVTRSAQPKVDDKGQQRYVRGSNAPMWEVQVLALDTQNEGGETLGITVAGEKPEVTVGQRVSPVGLIAIPWQNNGRGGLTYKADQLTVVNG